MIERLLLRLGHPVRRSTLEFQPGPLTIFVGPNNSGKSLALREIAQYPSLGAADATKLRLIEGLHYRTVSSEAAAELVRARTVRSEQGDLLTMLIDPTADNTGHGRLPAGIEDAIAKGEERGTRWLQRLYTLSLGGETRLTLTKAPCAAQ